MHDDDENRPRKPRQQHYRCIRMHAPACRSICSQQLRSCLERRVVCGFSTEVTFTKLKLASHAMHGADDQELHYSVHLKEHLRTERDDGWGYGRERGQGEACMDA